MRHGHAWALRIQCFGLPCYLLPVGESPRREIPAPAQLTADVPSVKVIVTAPEQLSVAVALPVCDVSLGEPQMSDMDGGHTMTGGMLSIKVMCCVQLAWFPQASMAIQVRLIPLPAQPAAVFTSE